MTWTAASDNILDTNYSKSASQRDHDDRDDHDDDQNDEGHQSGSHEDDGVHDHDARDVHDVHRVHDEYVYDDLRGDQRDDHHERNGWSES